MPQPRHLHMRFRFRSVPAFWAILVSATLTHAVQAGQTNQSGIEIDNFGQVNSNYYRGSQPNVAGFMQLKKLGVRSVIDLQKRRRTHESAWVRDAGMQYFNVPLSSRRPATAAQTEYFLKLVNDPENWPVYVHCAHGRHRAGEMTAIYRIAHDSWTASQAYEEMRRYRYYSFWGHGSLKKYVYRYYESRRSLPGDAVPKSAPVSK